MSLSVYNKKRDFSKTREPAGKKAVDHKFRFVVQKHQATRLHYDFRLELDGVLKSWAVPKGPSMNPADKRLAVLVEDHPVTYIDFKGTIPEGNYGAGKVEIWDHGFFEPVNEKHEIISENEALKALKKGDLKVLLKGKKLTGEFVLVNMKKDEKTWLLIKHKDAAAAKAVGSERHGKPGKLKQFIHPMLATAVKTPFVDSDWIFEIKWDGYRAISEINTKQISCYSRNGLDFTERFPSILEALKKLKEPAILDGEIVLLNNKGIPDFQKLQNYEVHQDLPLVYYVFDILEFNGKNIEDLPLTERKKVLKKYLERNKIIRYCDHIEKDGVGFLEKAKEKGLEGVMAKKKDSQYSRGYRSKQWLKIRNVQSTEAVIVGYTLPKGSRNHFGSLILAGKNGSQWYYRGHVGTGFSDELLGSLKKKMKQLETDKSPFKEKVPLNGSVTWLKPKLVADIAYTEITQGGIFRHPAFLRLRDDKTSSKVHDEIVKELKELKEVKENEIIKAGKYNVPISNPHKIYWPEEGYSKFDLINYYNEVSEYILPHLKDRPLSLKRNPNGILDEGFFHKDAGENVPEFVEVFPVNSESSKKVIDYIVCNNRATLIYLANLGCIEMNPWNSTTKIPEKPTWMVIDIDPSPKNSFAEVIDTALATKKVLDKAGLTGYCKTSGASGLHVFLPLKNRYDYEMVKDFAHVIASLVQEELPETTSLTRSLEKRGNKIYIDYLQNRSGQTLSSAYSVRPVKGANVSTPLEWKEVTHKLEPSQFNMKNIFTRLKSKGDLFKPVLTGSNNIQKALKLLNV
jgi:bifunctional non-homologous end joining protein LigD